MKYINLFLLFLILGIGLVVGNYIWKHEKSAVTSKIFPTEKQFSIDPPPSQARVGEIVSMSGEILWQSRVATESARIQKVQKLQQAELLATGKDGSASATFASAVDFQMGEAAEVEFLQTLPLNFVFRQNKGNILYEKTGDTPLSVKSLHLLTAVTKGKISINTDSEKHFIYLEIIEGAAKIAYNDIDYNTKTLELSKGDKLTYDDDKREIDIKKNVILE